MFNLVTSWQHMATFQSTTTRTYQDRTCRVCPTYSLGSQGCAPWLPATTAMKVGQTWKKQRGKQRSSKMFQDVSTDIKRCLNFRSSFRWISDEVSCTSLMTSPSRENMGNGDRCHRCSSLSHMAVDLLATKSHILFHSELPKKNGWPFGKDGLENPPFSLIFPLKPSFGGIFQPTFDFPIFGAIFFTEAMTGR